jgi:hypothetical protein
MFIRCICRRTLPAGLIALTFCLSSFSLQIKAQDSGSSSAGSTTSSPAGSVVMPPTSTRPSTPLTSTGAASTPHAIVLPPPPDDPAPALKAVAKKPVPAKKAATTKAATVKATTAKPPVVASPAAPVVQAPAAVQEPVAISAVPTPQADAAALNQGANTFGFYSGETREQIIAAIGKDNVLKQSGDILEVAASPKPDPNFETFLLIVGPQQGLVKLIATGKDIDGDPAGRQMKEQFTALRTTLNAGYGDPSDNFDFLNAKATHRSANQFMLSLTNSERSLAVYWTKKDFGNQITSISLNGNGLGSEKGYLSLEYEFAGYHAYLLAKK